ncbi:MAG: metalloregulator ArsR/SmtB family transcription factor [Patescibacteria group bacterium]
MNYQKAEKIYKALANRRRLAIIQCLSKEDKITVSDISEKIKLSLTSTSKHLQILKSAGLAESEQVNLEQHYFLVNKNNSFIKQALSVE